HHSKITLSSVSSNPAFWADAMSNDGLRRNRPRSTRPLKFSSDRNTGMGHLRQFCFLGRPSGKKTFLQPILGKASAQFPPTRLLGDLFLAQPSIQLVLVIEVIADNGVGVRQFQSGVLI